MRLRSYLAHGLALIWLGMAAGAAEAAGDLTVDQALELSAKSGKPIFAHAGSKT